MKLSLAVVFLFLMVTACTTPVERVSDTRSGQPETIITGASMDEVSSALITGMQDRGFVIQDQSRHSILFTRPMEGMNAALTQALIGNTYSTTPVSEIRFTLSENSGAIRVVAFMSVSTQMALGQVRRHAITDNVDWNAVYSFLNQLPVGDRL